MGSKPSRRERERQRHRREVLEVARDLFSRKGFERTSMSEIAEQAEFAVGTLYKLFKNKEALYRTLILDAGQEFEQALSAALKAPGTEIEKLERYIDTKATLFFRHIATARLYFSQTAGVSLVPTAGLDAKVRAIHRRVIRLLEAVLRSGIRRKRLADIDPKMLALGLEGVSNVFLGEMVERPEGFTAEEVAAAVKTMFFDRVRLVPVDE
jgi:TetR/AcrR family transcriptional regulator